MDAMVGGRTLPVMHPLGDCRYIASLASRSGSSCVAPDGGAAGHENGGGQRHGAFVAAPLSGAHTGRRQARAWLRRLARTGAFVAALAAVGVGAAPRPPLAPALAPALAPTTRCCRRPRRYRRGPGITPKRTRQIQAALVKAGYLKHVTGHWNWATHEALVRFQRDHHWQTRWVPDSRALIALGLGPKRDEPPAAPAKSRAEHGAAKAQNASGGAAAHSTKKDRNAHGHV